MTDLLIDGDLLLYRVACGVEKEVRWDAENHVLWSNVEDAWGCITENIQSLQERFQPQNLIVALTGKANFRKALYPNYKGNRQGARKPLCYGALVERVRETHTVVEYEGLEADDVLGILATRPNNRRKIVVSDDKDMKSVPCTLYVKGELTTVAKDEADYNHMYQTLCGDQSDNYPGCPGIGPVKAQKLLGSNPKDMWKVVVSAFGNEDEALVQARLARILRWEDWDSEKKVAILWSPKTH